MSKMAWKERIEERVERWGKTRSGRIILRIMEIEGEVAFWVLTALALFLAFAHEA